MLPSKNVGVQVEKLMARRSEVARRMATVVKSLREHAPRGPGQHVIPWSRYRHWLEVHRGRDRPRVLHCPSLDAWSTGTPVSEAVEGASADVDTEQIVDSWVGKFGCQLPSHAQADQPAPQASAHMTSVVSFPFRATHCDSILAFDFSTAAGAYVIFVPAVEESLWSPPHAEWTFKLRFYVDSENQFSDGSPPLDAFSEGPSISGRYLDRLVSDKINVPVNAPFDVIAPSPTVKKDVASKLFVALSADISVWSGEAVLQKESNFIWIGQNVRYSTEPVVAWPDHPTHGRAPG